jgi:hypothetical protein
MVDRRGVASEQVLVQVLVGGVTDGRHLVGRLPSVVQQLLPLPKRKPPILVTDA